MEEVATFREERDRVERQLIAENATQVMGVPLFRGMCADGTPLGCLHRIPFGSHLSEKIKAIVHDARFTPISALLVDKFWHSDDGGGDAETRSCAAEDESCDAS